MLLLLILLRQVFNVIYNLRNVGRNKEVVDKTKAINTKITLLYILCIRNNDNKWQYTK